MPFPRLGLGSTGVCHIDPTNPHFAWILFTLSGSVPLTLKCQSSSMAFRFAGFLGFEPANCHLPAACPGLAAACLSPPAFSAHCAEGVRLCRFLVVCVPS